MSKNQNQNIKEISAGIAKKFDGIIKNKGLSNTGSATITVTHIKNDKIRDASTQTQSLMKGMLRIDLRML